MVICLIGGLIYVVILFLSTYTEGAVLTATTRQTLYQNIIVIAPGHCDCTAGQNVEFQQRPAGSTALWKQPSVASWQDAGRGCVVVWVGVCELLLDCSI